MKVLRTTKHCFCPLIVALLLSAGLSILESPPALAQSPPAAATAKSSKETYRLRVENQLYGRVEVSTNGGASYILLGRVTHPSPLLAPDRTAKQAGTILRSSVEGMALAAGPGLVLKIRPAFPSTFRSPKIGIGEIITSIGTDRGVFSGFLPPAGSAAMLQTQGHSPGTFPDSYSISTSDAYVVVVELPLPPAPPGQQGQPLSAQLDTFNQSVRTQFESIASAYKDGSAQRAIAEKRKVVAGTLTLRPNLPPDEPDPITAVTYSIDDNVVCARTTAPYLFAWDTTSVPDEEHVIEIRALSSSGSIVTRTRYLVVISNHKPG